MVTSNSASGRRDWTAICKRALTLAIHYNHHSIVQLLVELGALLDLRVSEGWNTFD